MKKLILLTGDLASGKTTYSKILGEKFNIMVVNKDTVKEILGDRIHVETRAENKNLSVVCFDLFKYLIKQNSGNLLIESNFKPYEMEELEGLVSDYDVLTIRLKGDNHVLHERFNKRLTENRHYVHKSQDFTSIEPFIETLEELRSVKAIGEEMILDSTTFNYQNNKNVLAKIESFLNS